MGDIERWLRQAAGVHKVISEHVPVGDFYDEINRHRGYRACTLRLRAKTDMSLPAQHYLSQESQVAQGYGDPEILEITVKAGRGKSLLPSSILSRIGRWLPLPGFNNHSSPEFSEERYKLEEVEAIPQSGSSASDLQEQDDGALHSSVAAISLLSRLRKTYPVTVTPEGKLSGDRITNCLRAELREWLLPDLESTEARVNG